MLQIWSGQKRNLCESVQTHSILDSFGVLNIQLLYRQEVPLDKAFHLLDAVVHDSNHVHFYDRLICLSSQESVISTKEKQSLASLEMAPDAELYDNGNEHLSDHILLDNALPSNGKPSRLWCRLL